MLLVAIFAARGPKGTSGYYLILSLLYNHYYYRHIIIQKFNKRIEKLEHQFEDTCAAGVASPSTVPAPPSSITSSAAGKYCKHII